MVSVLVSHYERPGHLFRCLDALELNRDWFDEVVITDDGSKPEIVDTVKAGLGRYSFPVEYVWRPSDQFELAATRNEGIRRAKGDYFIIMDCDFLMMPDAIKGHVESREKGRFVVATFNELSEEDTEDLFTQDPLRPEYLEDLYVRQDLARIRKINFRFKRRNLLIRLKLAGPRKHSVGSHISIYREDLEKVNGYDENFVGWGGEDHDLGQRLITAGVFGKPAFLKARLMHMWHPKELGDQDWSAGRNVPYLNREVVPAWCENGLVNETAKGGRG